MFCLSLIRPGILFFSLTSFSIISFFRLMENLNQKDPTWRENGKGFVESVTRLLERLLDYRNVGQVSIVEYYFFLVKTEYFFLYFLRFQEKKRRKDMLAWAIFPFLCVFFFKVTLGSKSDFVEYYLNVFVTFIAIWLCQKLYLEKMPENISMEEKKFRKKCKISYHI